VNRQARRHNRIHIVSFEDDSDSALCGEPAIQLVGDRVVDQKGKPFYFVWDNEEDEMKRQQVNCEMCEREWKKRNPPVLRVVE
jgi:hypothetical protein